MQLQLELELKLEEDAPLPGKVVRWSQPGKFASQRSSQRSRHVVNALQKI